MSKRTRFPGIALAAAELGERVRTAQSRGEQTMCNLRCRFINPKNYMNVGVTVSWEVFDWGRKKRELAEEDLATDFAGGPHGAARLSWGGRA